MPTRAPRAASRAAPQALISWERGAPAPAGLSGLWSAGFIANRRELLARLGAPASISDLELAVGLYARYGSDAPRLVYGPFAWVLRDGGRRRLLAVRDRLGVHELWYREASGTLLLAGAIEPLLEISRPEINPRAVLAQLHGRAPAPGETFYRGISAVEPGGLLTVTDDRVAAEVYWRPGPRPLLRLRDDAAYAEAFRDLLLPIAAEYTPAGEVGVTLSGGLDSTTVAAALREAAPATACTAFSWIAPELPAADESAAVAAVCGRLGCRSVTIAGDQHWPLRGDPGIRPEAATPLANSYAGLWEASFRSVREHGVRVLFSGLSGDSLFGGDVFSYPDLLLTGRWRRLAAEIREQARHSEMTARQLVRWMTLAPIANAYLPARERRRSPAVPWLGERLRREAPAEPPPLSRRLLPGRRERLRQLRDPLLPVVAAQVTRQAAAHGIDFRHPLLDHRLFELAAALPTAQSFAAGRRKEIVRHAMRGLLPDAVLDRRDKTYPEAIFRRGLRERERAKAWALMTGMRAARMGFVDERRLREAYADYLAGRSRSARFWHTLTLEAWLREHAA